MSFVVVSIFRVVVVTVGCTLFFGMLTTGRTGLRGGNSSRTVPGRTSLSLLSSSSSKSCSGMDFCVVVVVNLELVRTEVEVFLDGCDVRGLVNVVAGTEGIGAFVVCDGSSMQLVTGPLHCPVDVQVIKLGPSALKPREH